MKIGFVSLGCPKNLVDSEVMMGLSEQGGHTLTSDASEAEVLVVNTCAFIDAAKEESINTILELAEFKKTGACQRLVVTGCLGERYRDELRGQIPEIDAVLGTGDVPEIVGAIEGVQPRGVIPLTLVQNQSPILASAQHGERAEAFGEGGPNPQSRELPTYLYDSESPRVLATPRHFAYVKVAEGCDYKCSFCIIPTLRGHYRSRPVDAIVREARSLAARGVREIILISQDTTFYGRDLAGGAALPALLRQLNCVEGIDWIRLLYLYPTTITDAILDAIAEYENVCKYIDLPLQHAADEVLRRMKRPGTGRTYARLLDKIRRRIPGVTLRTTFIVGFPGETQAEFEELCAFVREVRFDHVGVFTYSHEEGTTAHDLPDDVPAAVKLKRRARLMAEQKRIVTRAQRERVGTRVRVMVDGPSPDHELVWRGRLCGQAPEIDPVVYLTEADSDSLHPGTLLEVEIVDSKGYDLVARPT
jgi:ribosomal protein S12 methylthiotransferase